MQTSVSRKHLMHRHRILRLICRTNESAGLPHNAAKPCTNSGSVTARISAVIGIGGSHI